MRDFLIPYGEQLSVHPLLKRVPEMPEDLYQQLKEDVSGLGVLVPVILVDGMILDGRARYRACQELGIECPGRFIDGVSPHDVVRSMNLHRSHLTEDQQAEVSRALVMPY